MERTGDRVEVEWAAEGGLRSRCAEQDGFSLHGDVEVGPHDRGRLERLCRYILRPAIATERLRESGSRDFFVVQCLPADTPRAYPLSMSWRLLLLSPSGAVREELFAFDQRGERLYRTVLARLASPAGLGFHSQVLAVWPGFGFPFLYPFVSVLVGALLMSSRGLAYLIKLRPRPA